MDNVGTTDRPNDVGYGADTLSVDNGIAGPASRPFFRSFPTSDQVDTFICERFGGMAEHVSDLAELGKLLKTYEAATHQPDIGEAQTQLFSAIRILAGRGNDAIEATNKHFGNTGH